MGGAGAWVGRGWGVGGAWVGRHLAIPRAIQRPRLRRSKPSWSTPSTSHDSTSST